MLTSIRASRAVTHEIVLGVSSYHLAHLPKYIKDVSTTSQRLQSNFIQMFTKQLQSPMLISNLMMFHFASCDKKRRTIKLISFNKWSCRKGLLGFEFFRESDGPGSLRIAFSRNLVSEVRDELESLSADWQEALVPRPMWKRTTLRPGNGRSTVFIPASFACKYAMNCCQLRTWVPSDRLQIHARCLDLACGMKR